LTKSKLIKSSARLSHFMPCKNRFLRSWLKALLLVLGAIATAINGIAWMHAHKMTHYVDVGQRTGKPESLFWINKLQILLTGVEVPRPVNRQTPQDYGLAYETHRIAVANQTELEAWFMPHSQSRGVAIAFPGYAASKAGILAPAKILHELGYDVLLVDFRGAGGSTGSDTTLGVREAEDVVHAVAYAKQHWAGRSILLYGASMGAVAVMRAIAVEGITPTAVILESPFDSLLNTVRHRFAAMGVPSFPAAELLVFWGGVQQGIDGFAHNPAEYAKAIRCPVLLMQGEADKRVTVPDAAAIFANLPGQKAFVVFPQAIGHGSLAQDDASQWRQQAQQFLQSAQR
jgi:alpha-beta hydrolase superfamily lysophospholipase